MATLKTVITRAVGPTTNKAFSQLFATLVTPAPFVFLIWPVIALLQLLTVTFSAFRSGAPMTQVRVRARARARVSPSQSPSPSPSPSPNPKPSPNPNR